MSSSESRVSKFRLMVCDVAIPVYLCVMKLRCINLTVTLSKDKRADQACTASLIIILRLKLRKGCKQLTRPIHISRRSTQPHPYRKACRFQCLETRPCGAVQSCALTKHTIVPSPHCRHSNKEQELAGIGALQIQRKKEKERARQTNLWASSPTESSGKAVSQLAGCTALWAHQQ